MAARNRKGLSENTRKRIQTSMIINRLQAHILSDGDLMTSSQVQAANILLKKTLPDQTESSNETTLNLPKKIPIELVQAKK